MAQMMMGAMQGAPGAQAMVLCPACRAQNPQTAKFCSSCGGLLAPKPAVTVACPKCQAQNPQGAKFCTSCGNAFV
jgi:protein phosphatase